MWSVARMARTGLYSAQILPCLSLARGAPPRPTNCFDMCIQQAIRSSRSHVERVVHAAIRFFTLSSVPPAQCRPPSAASVTCMTPVDERLVTAATERERPSSSGLMTPPPMWSHTRRPTDATTAVDSWPRRGGRRWAGLDGQGWKGLAAQLGHLDPPLSRHRQAGLCVTSLASRRAMNPRG